MSEEKVTVYELVEREDNTVGIGNSIELTKKEAIAMIKTGGAKHPDFPIDPDTKTGSYPPEWDAEEDGDDLEDEDDVGNKP